MATVVFGQTTGDSLSVSDPSVATLSSEPSLDSYRYAELWYPGERAVKMTLGRKVRYLSKQTGRWRKGKLQYIGDSGVVIGRAYILYEDLAVLRFRDPGQDASRIAGGILTAPVPVAALTVGIIGAVLAHDTGYHLTGNHPRTMTYTLLMGGSAATIALWWWILHAAKTYDMAHWQIKPVLANGRVKPSFIE